MAKDAKQADISRGEINEYLKAKIDELETNSKINIREFV
jgi:hypothetical protein